MPKSAHLLQVALCERYAHLWEQAINFVEEVLDHLPDHMGLIKAPLQGHLGIEDGGD